MAIRKRRAKPISVEFKEAEELNTEMDIVLHTLARWIREEVIREFNRETVESCNYEKDAAQAA